MLFHPHHTVSKKNPTKAPKTPTYQAVSRYALPKSVPGLPGAWSPKKLSTEWNLCSKLKKNRDKRLCPEFQVKKEPKKHDTRKTFMGPSVYRTQTFKIKNMTFMDDIRATYAFSILFSKQNWHSIWVSHMSF